VSSRAFGSRAFVLSLAVLAATSGCAATHRAAPAGHADPWKGALGVVTGREVEVILFTGDRVTGRLADVSDDGVTIRTGPTSVEHRERAAVSRVSLLQRGRDSVRNGALIGAAIGVGYALGVAAYYSSEDDGLNPSKVGAMSIIAAGIGAGVGAMTDNLRQGTTRRTIYDASLPRRP
jgi:hypothetical protein